MGAMSVTACCLLICGLLVVSVHSQGCTFPTDLDGVFDSSHERDQMTFNSTHVSPFWVDTQSHLFENLTFECSFINGSKYIVRSSEPIIIYTVPYYVYSCWELTRLSANRFAQFQGTSKLASAADLNYKIYPIAYAVSSPLICDVSDLTGDTVSMLVKPGTGTSDKSTCPVDMWGKYIYTMTDTSGTSYCNLNSWLDICTATDTLTINTTLCSDTVFYSSGGSLTCMYYMADSSASNTYYVYLYNGDSTVDDSTTYRFVCVVMKYSASVTYMTQYPKECLDSSSQNATYMTTSPGGLYTMYANVTCPPTSDSTDYTIIIVATVVSLLLIIIILIIVCACYYKKVYLPRKEESKITPDTLPNTAMSGSAADKNYRMMFTPAPPKSAVPGRRQGQAAAGQEANQGSRAASAASLRPTVSALATYRTPSPYVTDGKDIDVDSLLDFDYPASKQTLGDPDGAESGVLLEMEGSIPVYSEAGDTPEPTRMTPVNSGKR